MGDSQKNRDNARKQTGRIGEDAASHFLARKGFRLIERNYRRPWGEIDIVGEKDDVIRFVEVKTITGLSREMHYNPEDLVDERKLQKLVRTATLYMEEKKDKREFQIDVVGVFLEIGKRIARCRLLEQAL